MPVDCLPIHLGAIEAQNMATIQVTPSGTFRVQIRRRGLPAVSKTLKSRKTAREWARKTERD